jgi:hypothetical protein
MTNEQRTADAAAAAANIVVMDLSAVARDELDDWLDTEHIPQRLALPGFTGAQRWLAADGSPTSLVVYELTGRDVLASRPYLAVAGDNQSPWSRRILGRCRRTRYEADLVMHLVKPGADAAEGLLMVAMNVEPAMEADFDRWYSEEHLPALFALPGVLDARRYTAVAGGQKHIAMYHLADPDVQASEAWKKAIDTPWGSRVRPHTRDRVRYVCRRYHRSAA